MRLAPDRPDDRDVAFDLTLDELYVIAEIGRRRSSDGGELDPSDGSDDDRPTARETALESLVGRGVIQAPDDGVAVLLTPYDAVLDVVVSSSLYVQCARLSNVGSDMRCYHVRPEVGVEQALGPDEVHRFVRFDVAELFERILAFVDLRTNAPPPIGAEFVGTLREVLELEQQGRSGALGNGTHALPHEAHPFLAAVAGDVSSYNVSCIHKTDGIVAGGELTWYDAGPGGLWIVEREPGSEAAEADDENVLVNVRSVGADWIANELLSYLPGDASAATAQPAAT